MTVLDRSQTILEEMGWKQDMHLQVRGVANIEYPLHTVPVFENHVERRFLLNILWGGV